LKCFEASVRALRGNEINLASRQSHSGANPSCHLNITECYPSCPQNLTEVTEDVSLTIMITDRENDSKRNATRRIDFTCPGNGIDCQLPVR